LSHSSGAGERLPPASLGKNRAAKRRRTDDKIAGAIGELKTKMVFRWVFFLFSYTIRMYNGESSKFHRVRRRIDKQGDGDDYDKTTN
uniref:Uncharacterized protein n=1 Tax=Romanomermis culicivorax TaxID=13658 RepID=A0A915J9P5_ROMCU